MQNPITYVKEKVEEKKESRSSKKEREYWDDVLDNLETFNGRPESQKEVRNVER